MTVKAPSASADGTAEASAAFRDAIASLPDSGGNLIIPPGTYAVRNLAVPEFPKVVNILGTGPRSTTLVAAAPDSPILTGPASGVAQGNRIGGFSVQSHAGGSNGPALDLSGYRSCNFFDIEYLSNGSANFAKFFVLRASPGLCYGNIIDHAMVSQQSGPEVVFSFENDDRGAGANANHNFIKRCWVYETKGISVIVDARRSASTNVEECLFEACPGAVGVIPGTLSRIRDNWFESLGVSIVPKGGPDGASNNVVLAANYFSGGFMLSVPTAFRDWSINDNSGLRVRGAGINAYVRNTETP